MRHLSWGTMGARGRTNPERLPRGGGAELKWKQRAGAVWEATKTKAAAEGPPPPPVSHPRSWNHTPTPTAVSGWRSRSPHREVGPGTRSGLISPGAAVALGSPSRAHHQPVTASSPDSGWAGGHHTEPTGDSTAPGTTQARGGCCPRHAQGEQPYLPPASRVPISHSPAVPTGRRPAAT